MIAGYYRKKEEEEQDRNCGISSRRSTLIGGGGGEIGGKKEEEVVEEEEEMGDCCSWSRLMFYVSGNSVLAARLNAVKMRLSTQCASVGHYLSPYQCTW